MRKLVAAAAAVEMRIAAPQTMVLAAPVVLAMETAAAVAVVVVMLLRVEPEAQGEPRISRPWVSLAASAEREAISPLAASAGLLDCQEEAPVTKVQRVQHAKKLEGVEQESPLVEPSLESVVPVVAAAANMGLKNSQRCLLGPVAVAVAPMILAPSLEGPEVLAAELFS